LRKLKDTVSTLCFHKPKEVVRDGEMAFRRKKLGIEKKEKPQIPPVKFK